MVESSKTIVPEANIYKPHQETGDTNDTTFEQWCKFTAQEAAKQSTKRDKTQ